MSDTGNSKSLSQIKGILLSLQSLVIYDDILADKRINSFCKLLEQVVAQKWDSEKVYVSYHQFYKLLINDSWKEYIVELLLNTNHELIALATRLPKSEINTYISENIGRDLGIIQALADIKPQDILILITSRFTNESEPDEKDVFIDHLWPGNWPVWRWELLQPVNNTIEITGLPAAEWLEAAKDVFVKKYLEQIRWENNTQRLLDYYQTVGYSIFSQYAAFKLHEGGQRVEGVENPDPIRISHLICQEREQSLILYNTESFLQGYPANNIILYGNRGTGKSSLVKALLNEYIAKGLRIVQLKKNQIGLFPELVGELAKIPLKFIIFIDDLSFNDVEEDYKNLKSLLEGGVESRPQNVLVYATSNRRHLVKESFVDRKGDDVHAHDNMEEKLSLADRFGITVTFLSPDQETYLKIVEGLACQNKIDLDRDVLRKKALQWVMMHNGRSGRTARQFIDHLIGELALSKG